MFHLPLGLRALAPALALLLFPVAILSAAPPDTRCFELRIYTAAPGKLEALHARFRDHTLALFERHGMTNIGYWTPSPNPEQKLVYLLAYPSKEAREESWNKFQADPDWVKAKGDSELQGKLVAKVEQRFLQPTDFSPEIKPVAASAQRVFELRTYEATQGKLEHLLQVSSKHAAELFKSYDIEFLGAWAPLAGATGGENLLTYLVAYPNAAAIETSLKKMAEDSRLQTIGEELEKAAGGPPLAEGGIVTLELIPTDFSPMK